MTLRVPAGRGRTMSLPTRLPGAPPYTLAPGRPRGLVRIRPKCLHARVLSVCTNIAKGCPPARRQDTITPRPAEQGSDCDHTTTGPGPGNRDLRRRHPR